MSKAQENASDHVMIGFNSVSDWMKEWQGFLDQSHCEVKQNQCDSGLPSGETSWKIVLLLNVLAYQDSTFGQGFLKVCTYRSEFSQFYNIFMPQ